MQLLADADGNTERHIRTQDAFTVCCGGKKRSKSLSLSLLPLRRPSGAASATAAAAATVATSSLLFVARRTPKIAGIMMLPATAAAVVIAHVTVESGLLPWILRGSASTGCTLSPVCLEMFSLPRLASESLSRRRKRGSLTCPCLAVCVAS